MGKIITDNLAYVRTVQEMGMRENAKNTDLSDVLPEDIEQKVKEAAEISMGTEISDHDMINIRHLCNQVIAKFYFFSPTNYSLMFSFKHGIKISDRYWLWLKPV